MQRRRRARSSFAQCISGPDHVDPPVPAVLRAVAGFPGGWPPELRQSACKASRGATPRTPAQRTSGRVAAAGRPASASASSPFGARSGSLWQRLRTVAGSRLGLEVSSTRRASRPRLLQRLQQCVGGIAVQGMRGLDDDAGAPPFMLDSASCSDRSRTWSTEIWPSLISGSGTTIRMSPGARRSQRAGSCGTGHRPGRSGAQQQLRERRWPLHVAAGAGRLMHQQGMAAIAPLRAPPAQFFHRCRQPGASCVTASRH